MKRQRRTADPLAPLLPVARVAAVGLVVVGATLAAVHAVTSTASTQPPSTSAARLVAIPHYPSQIKQATSSATITDQAEIARVAQIVNTLPPAPTGAFSCPFDWGYTFELDFESSSGAVLEHVVMYPGGCGGASVTIDGERQPDRSSGLEPIQRIQGILGTHWQFTPPLPG